VNSLRVETRTETVTSTANTSGQRDTVLTVPAGGAWKITEVKFFLEGSAGQAVDVQAFYGEKPIAPHDDKIDISGDTITLPTSQVVSPDDEIDVRHDNNDGSDHEFTTIVVLEKVE